MNLEPVMRMNRDLRNASKTMTSNEARFLVNTYYQIQDYRKATGLQVNALEKDGKPHETISWFFAQHEFLEGQIRGALDAWSDVFPLGRWAKSIIGIGPVLASGLMAHIDITKAPTAGHIWSFAGLDPTAVWKEKQKRPWNADLKLLCWKIGESFVKTSPRENDVYGHIWVQRKELEVARNIAGEFRELAGRALTGLREGKDSEAKYWNQGCLTPAQFLAYYEATPLERLTYASKNAGPPDSGVRMLTPGHIQSRSKRYATKLFLAHYHEVAYRFHYGVMPPKPYVFEHLGHVHKMEVPNNPFS